MWFDQVYSFMLLNCIRRPTLSVFAKLLISLTSITFHLFIRFITISLECFVLAPQYNYGFPEQYRTFESKSTVIHLPWWKLIIIKTALQLLLMLTENRTKRDHADVLSIRTVGDYCPEAAHYLTFGSGQRRTCCQLRNAAAGVRGLSPRVRKQRVRAGQEAH